MGPASAEPIEPKYRMPAGQLQRIDTERQTAYIVRSGKTYVAPLSEVETSARVPSARVRFDLVRRHGTESAAGVRLLAGTRSNRRQRRFGDLTGAARPGAKVETPAARNFGVDVRTQPFKVADAWLLAIDDRDFDGATSLYLPEGVLRVGAEEAAGHHAIRAVLERLPFDVVDRGSAAIHGIDRYVRVDFMADGDDHVTYLEIDRGSIVEQWIDEEPKLADEEPDDGPVDLIRRGDVPDSAGDYAVEKVRHVADHTGHPLRSARVKLSKEGNPAFDRPARAEAVLEFEDVTIRAHGNADSFTEAVDIVAAKLGARLEHRSDRQRHRPDRREPVPGNWRHGNLGRTEKPYFDRPVAEREVVRHKSFAPEDMAVEEAIWDMALLDYDFFLFVEIETGHDAVLEHSDNGPLRVHLLGSSVPDLGSVVDDVEPVTTPVPELTVGEAIELLNAGGDNLQFFANRSTGRGNVVYRRLDGHYGLITPFDES